MQTLGSILKKPAHGARVIAKTTGMGTEDVGTAKLFSQLLEHTLGKMGSIRMPAAPLPEGALRFVYKDFGPAEEGASGSLHAFGRPAGSEALSGKSNRLLPVEGVTQTVVRADESALAKGTGVNEIEEFLYFGIWLEVISSNVAKIRYMVDSGVLTVQFLNGYVYEYPGISVHMAFAFTQTNSKGRWVWDFLRSAKRPYRFLYSLTGKIPVRSPHIQSKVSQKRYLRALALQLKATGKIKVTKAFLRRNSLFHTDPGTKAEAPKRRVAPMATVRERDFSLGRKIASTIKKHQQAGAPMRRSQEALKRLLGK